MTLDEYINLSLIHIYALSNMVNKFTDYPVSKHYFDLFEQVWHDKEKLTDVTDRVIDHISTVYKENSPEFIYFLILYNIFNEFLEDISQDLLPNEMCIRDSCQVRYAFSFKHLRNCHSAMVGANKYSYAPI